MTAKLGNEAFTAKAPADVIEKSRARLADGRGGHRPAGVPASRPVIARGDDPPYPPERATAWARAQPPGRSRGRQQ